MPKKTTEYRTTRDIVIPSGTVVGSPPTKSSTWGTYWEACVGLDRDHTAYLSLDVEDGVRLGLLEEAE